METQAQPRQSSTRPIRTILQILAPGLALVALLLGYFLLSGAFSDPEVASYWEPMGGFVFVAGAMTGAVFLIGAVAGSVLFLSGRTWIEPIWRILAPGVVMVNLFVGTLLLFGASSSPDRDFLLKSWLLFAACGFVVGVLLGGVLLLGSRGRSAHSRTGQVWGWAATVLGVPALILLYLVTVLYALMTREVWW